MDARRPVLRLPKSSPRGGLSNLSAGLNFACAIAARKVIANVVLVSIVEYVKRAKDNRVLLEIERDRVDH